MSAHFQSNQRAQSYHLAAREKTQSHLLDYMRTGSSCRQTAGTGRRDLAESLASWLVYPIGKGK